MERFAKKNKGRKQRLQEKCAALKHKLISKRLKKDLEIASAEVIADCVPGDIMQYHYIRLMLNDFDMDIKAITESSALTPEEIHGVLEKFKELINERQEKISNTNIR